MTFFKNFISSSPWCQVVMVYASLFSSFLHAGLQAGYNGSTIIPKPETYHSANDGYGAGYSYYYPGDGSDEPFNKKPPSPPSPYHDHARDQLTWLVPVLQYLLTVSQDDKSSITTSITPIILFLPVLIPAINWWFAEEQAEATARQYGHTLLGSPFVASLADNTVPMLEAPRQTGNKKLVFTAQGGQGSGEGSGQGETGAGNHNQNPEGDEGQQGSGDRPPAAPHPSPQSGEASGTSLIVHKTIEVGGRSYTLTARLQGDNEKLFCNVCRNLVQPNAHMCGQCNKAICSEHLPNLQREECPTCRHDVLHEKDLSPDLAQLLWECPDCHQTFTASVMHSHLLACGSAWSCAFADHGCEATGNYGQILSHETRCDFRLETCPNQGCTEIVLQRDHTSHAIVCRYSPTLVTGTTFSGPRYLVEPVNRAIPQLSELQQEGAQATPISEGFTRLLELVRAWENRLLAEAGTGTRTGTTEPQQYGATGNMNPAQCQNCMEPIEGTGDHECGVYTCPVCRARLNCSDKAFHSKYCHSVFSFRGQYLTLTHPADSIMENAVIRYEDDISDLFILPAGTIYHGMADKFLKSEMFNMQLRPGMIKPFIMHRYYNRVSSKLSVFDENYELITSTNFSPDCYQKWGQLQLLPNHWQNVLIFCCSLIR